MVKILQGDCLAQLKTLADQSVHMCVTSPPYWGLRSYLPAGHPLKHLEIGSEKTMEEYVAKMVAVFAEVRRVLRDDGTCWVNLGDSYSAHAGQRKTTDQRGPKQCTNRGSADTGSRDVPGLKAKDLCMIPARVAMALQVEGWYLRSEITWCKRSAMPESVTDRPSNASEKIFLLSKSSDYSYDSMAVRNPLAESTLPQLGQRYGGNGQKDYLAVGVQDPSDTKRRIIESMERNGGSNLRNYWLLGPEPFSDAHFATFPSEIPRRCILLGTSAKGCCPKCGAPWERMVECVKGENPSFNGSTFTNGKSAHGKHNLGQGERTGIRVETGWQPTCECGDTIVTPATVLDPFGGSGTVGQVATELGRNSILIELNPEYVKLINDRTNVTQGLPLA